MLTVSLLLLAISQYPTSTAGVPFETAPPYWGNCPTNAVENQACREGRGYCAYPGEAPASSEAQLKCMPGRPCLSLPTDPHGFFMPVNLSDITMGATATLTCCEGYETTADVEVTCDVFQNWTDPSEACQPVDCGDTPPGNTTFTYLDGTSYTDFALLECSGCTGPVDSSTASSVAVCAADGTWETSLECIPVLRRRSGTSFLFGFMSNLNTNADLRVYVISSEPTQVTISAPLTSFTTTTTVSGSAEIVIPSIYRTPPSTGVFNLGFLVDSDKPIDVYVEDPRIASNEGSTIFPETHLSTEYAIASWRELYASSIAVVGAVDGTVVTITLPGGGTVTATINQYQLYHYMSPTSDLTGAMVSCSENCAVFSGSQCTNVIDKYCDFLYEQMPPIAELQMKYIASFPYPRRRFALRIIAVEDNTNVQTTGQLPGTLNKGQFIQYSLNDLAVAVVSDKPVLVADYALGRRAPDPYTSFYHDPAMIVLPGIEGCRSYYDFMVPTNVQSAAIMIIIPSDAVSSLVLNNSPFSPVLTRQVNMPGEGSYTILYSGMLPGHHEISADIPFIVSLSFFRVSAETWLTLPFNF